MTNLRTQRLLLRPWKESDFEAFAKLNADIDVMAYFPHTLSQNESDAMAERIKKGIEEKGWGLWAASIVGGADFIGFIGLNIPLFEADFMPAVEVGWRLAKEFWGKGYATEGALAAIDYGFNVLKLEKIISFTTPLNTKSLAVMHKLAMQPAGEFEHPKIPKSHPLRRHLLYSIHKEKKALSC